jgi:hypothetical protein
LQTRGAIYHHNKLVFHNGFTGKKYLILLNTPVKNEPYLFVKTTSQKIQEIRARKVRGCDLAFNNPIAAKNERGLPRILCIYPFCGCEIALPMPFI